MVKANDVTSRQCVYWLGVVVAVLGQVQCEVSVESGQRSVPAARVSLGRCECR
jgi:hypothetical protein